MALEVAPVGINETKHLEQDTRKRGKGNEAAPDQLLMAEGFVWIPACQRADQPLQNLLLIQWFSEAEFFQVHNLSCDLGKWNCTHYLDLARSWTLTVFDLLVL